MEFGGAMLEIEDMPGETWVFGGEAYSTMRRWKEAIDVLCMLTTSDCHWLSGSGADTPLK